MYFYAPEIRLYLNLSVAVHETERVSDYVRSKMLSHSGGGGCSDFPYGIGFAVLFRLNVVSGYNSHCTG